LRVAFARPHAAKCGSERFLLLRSRKLGYAQNMADGDLVFEKCLGHGRYQVSKSDTTVLCCAPDYVAEQSPVALGHVLRGEEHNITR